MKIHFHFSVGTLLVVTSLFSVVLWLTYRVPAPIGVPVLTLLTVIFPAFLAITAIYGNRSMRPFCIGALFPMGASLLNSGGLDINWKTFQGREQDAGLDPGLIAAMGSEFYTESDQGFLGLAIITAVATGFLCSLLHWWLTRNNRCQVIASLDESDRPIARSAA